MRNARDIDIIMQNFYKTMQSKDSMKKTAGELDSPESSASAINPEDFLLEEEERHLSSSDQLGEAIDSLDEKLADDFCSACNMAVDECICNKAEDIEEPADQDDCGDAAMPMMADDLSYLIDSHATEVLHGLGKIATDLRNKGKGFAADVVEATAFSIRDDLVKEASEKLHVVSSLEKIASDLKKEDPGDFSIDLIQASINRIKNQKIEKFAGPKELDRVSRIREMIDEGMSDEEIADIISEEEGPDFEAERQYDEDMMEREWDQLEESRSPYGDYWRDPESGETRFG